ncbi:long-chain-fatty-acid--CoA ligase [Pseudonocardia spinosispora]|uniref:long-chain-fatty-acid--CoA ligase n=1 Tax=Pseudonocardia spinosispora TaxID=103441 RepID=UPI0004223433|nr:long-chain-fatty-acid--CoA ligase [Pseudonocardia spinosispora]
MITALLSRWASERAEREALRYGDSRWSWAELADRVARAAAAQRAAGLRPGARVAVLDFNHPSCLETTLACAQVGTANVVVNFRLTPSEVEYVLNDSEAEVLFVGPEFASTVEQLRDKLPKVRRVIHVGGDEDSYESWLDVEPDQEVHPADPDDCFLQLYTSGTTGFPKGAMLTHRAMVAHSANVSATIGAQPDDAFMVAMPLFHVGGSSYALCALYTGARMVMVRTPEPATLLRLLESERITHSFFVPALLALMAKVPDATKHDYSALKVLCYGASPMPLPVLRASMKVFPNVFMQVYGMTEACGVVTVLGPEDHAEGAPEQRLISAGQPMDGVSIEVREPATGEPVPTGQQGEVWVRTEQLMSGYWNRPEATASAIGEDGWYHSGDAGHFDTDGYLYITDRIKDMIISGGENIYPAEIERVLAEHPSVGDLTVVGVPDDKWGEVPKAVVVAAEGHTVDEAELLAYCREHLASYKCPKSVDVVDELPRNPTGKILKKDVRARYWGGRERQTV